MSSGFLRVLQEALAPEGLNHIGVARASAYDAIAPGHLQTQQLWPGTRAIVVIGSGGALYWRRFLDYLHENPVDRLAQEPHPLDTFSRVLFERIAPELNGCRVFFPFFASQPRLDFLKLAELAGLGRPSELGLLVSERFGPWFALRGAIFAPHDLSPSPAQRRLCDGCPAPCRVPCPPQIVGAGPFDWKTCTRERQQLGSPCQISCGARNACIVMPDERYDALQQLYHAHLRSGRQALCARLGVKDEVDPTLV